MIQLAHPLSDMDIYILLGTCIIATTLILCICALVYVIDGHAGQTEWWNTRQSDKPAKFTFTTRMANERQQQENNYE